MDYDSVWKEALDRYFHEMLEFFFPALAALLDWRVDHESLDAELRKLTPEARTGKRLADKLIKVFRKDRESRLIHVEVQVQREADFEHRMYVYDYRIYDVYKIHVWNLVILGDEEPAWRPQEYLYREEGFDKRLSWKIVKLLDYAARLEEIEQGPELFGRLVVAHLVAQQTQQDMAQRAGWKLRLLRGLFWRKLEAEDMRQWSRYIDWLLPLPEPMERELSTAIEVTEKENAMPYITSWERLGRADGLKEGEVHGLLAGVETALDLRFGVEGLALMDTLRQLEDASLLQRLLVELRRRDATLEDVRALLRKV